MVEAGVVMVGADVYEAGVSIDVNKVEASIDVIRAGLVLIEVNVSVVRAGGDVIQVSIGVIKVDIVVLVMVVIGPGAQK